MHAEKNNKEVRPAPSGRRLSGAEKFSVDMLPLAVFMLAYFAGRPLADLFASVTGRGSPVQEGKELFLAIGLFLPAYFTAFVYSVWKEKRVAPMLLLSGLMVGILGGLTLFLGNRQFFYMKPTIAYAIFTMLLAGGLVAKKNFLRTILDGTIRLPDGIWRTLTVRYALFFAVLAFVNEVAWRYFTRDCDISAPAGEGGICPGEKHWVNLKIFGFTIASLVFTALQAPLVTRHILKD